MKGGTLQRAPFGMHLMVDSYSRTVNTSVSAAIEAKIPIPPVTWKLGSSMISIS